MSNTVHEYLLIQAAPDRLGALDAALAGPDTWHVPMDAVEPLSRTLARLDGATGWDLHKAGYAPLSAHAKMRAAALCAQKDVAGWKALRAARWAPFPPPEDFPLSPGCVLDMLTPRSQPLFRNTPLSFPKLLPLHTRFLLDGWIGDPNGPPTKALLQGDGGDALPSLGMDQGWWYARRDGADSTNWMGMATGTTHLSAVTACLDLPQGRAYRWTAANSHATYLHIGLMPVLRDLDAQAFAFWHEDGGRAGWWHLDGPQQRHRSGAITVPSPQEMAREAHQGDLAQRDAALDAAVVSAEWDRWHAAWPSRVAAIALRHAAHLAGDDRWAPLAEALAPYGDAG